MLTKSAQLLSSLASKALRSKSFWGAATAALVLGLAPSQVQATPYEVFVDVDSEDDLYDLQVANVIDDETFETLVELMQRGVDLNTASRKTLYALPNLTLAEVDAILAYRDVTGRISEPSILVSQGILRGDKLNAIAAFLVIGSADESIAASGVARLQTRYSIEDTGAPASALQLRAQAGQNFTGGLVAVNTRLRLGEVRYDPVRGALSAEEASDSVRIPKAFVQWEGETFSAIAGTYRTGFGQRLTFDNTNQSDPDGFYGDRDVFHGSELTRDCKLSTGELSESPCPAADGYTYVTPDYKSRDGLMGVAASMRELKLGSGQLEAHAFLSYQPRSIYQYELYDPSMCEDPRLDTPECSAPDVYRTSKNPLDASPEYSFQTLPNVYAEKIAGGNLSYSLDRRTHLGITGYGAQVDWLIEGTELDFQEWSSLPFGGSFGAVGMDAAKGIGNTDLHAEVTKSFDGMPSGGGLGALVRAVTAWGKNEVESSFRYYDQDFANPHARPIAAADEYDGLRARDETGARVQYTGEFDKRFRVRSKLDLWTSPSESTKEIAAFARGDMVVSDRVSLGLWTLYQDRDLARSGRDECFAGEEDDIGPNGPLSCAGQKMQATTRVRVSPNRDLWFDLQYQHELLDDSKYDGKYRQDVSVVATLTAKLKKDFRVRARSRYLFEDISDKTYLETTWASYADLTYSLRKRDKLRIRYDLIMHLDDRSATDTRSPNPEHWMRLEYQASF